MSEDIFYPCILIKAPCYHACMQHIIQQTEQLLEMLMSWT